MPLISTKRNATHRSSATHGQRLFLIATLAVACTPALVPPPPRSPVGPPLCGTTPKIETVSTEHAPDARYVEDLVLFGEHLYQGTLQERAILVAHQHDANHVDAFIYDPVRDRWQHARQELPHAEIHDVEAFAAGERLVVLWSVSHGKDGWQIGGALLDPAAAAFHELPSAPRGFYYQTVAFAAGSLYLFGTGDRPTDYRVGVRFDVDAWRWSRLPAAGAPSPRMHETVVATDGGVLVWGGYRGEEGGPLLADGAFLDARTNTWRATPAIGAPAERIDAHAYAWHDRALVWSGHLRDSSSWARDAFVYDARANTWRDVTHGAGLADAPASPVDAVVALPAGPRVLMRSASGSTRVFDLDELAWHEIDGIPGWTSAAALGQRGLGLWIQDHVVAVDLIELRSCQLSIGAHARFSSRDMLLTWGSERSFGVWGGYEREVETCGGRPCIPRAPHVHLEPVGVRVRW